jgi:lysozyme
MSDFLNAILSLLQSLFGAGANKNTPVAPVAPTSKPRGVSSTSLIREFEGLRLTAYLDPVNIWTIGYGHTKTAKSGMSISQAGAEALLKHDLAWVEDCINTKVKVPLSNHQYDALASLIYNIGAGAFSKSTLLRKLNASDYAGAANEFQRWNKAGGKVLAGLTRRRAAEMVLFNVLR